MIDKLTRFMGDPSHERNRRRTLYVSLVLVVLADFLVSRGHGYFAWDHWAGWNAVYGLVSCILIIIVSKFLGHQGGLMKREDYYD